MSGFDQAFHWIIDKLDQRPDVPYVITGGLAARAYGATRPVNDIDIELPFDQAAGLFDDLHSYLPPTPVVLKDDYWDLVYYIFEYAGQVIEIGDSRRIYVRNPMTGDLVKKEIDFKNRTRRILNGRSVWVIARDELIFYKQLRARPEDLQDIAEMK